MSLAAFINYAQTNPDLWKKIQDNPVDFQLQFGLTAEEVNFLQIVKTKNVKLSDLAVMARNWM